MAKNEPKRNSGNKGRPAAVTNQWTSTLDKISKKIGVLQDAATAANNKYLAACTVAEAKQNELSQQLSMYSTFWSSYAQWLSYLYVAQSPADVKAAYDSILTVRSNFFQYFVELLKRSTAVKKAESEAAARFGDWRVAVDTVDTASVAFMAADCFAANFPKAPITKKQVDAAVKLAKKEAGVK